MGQAPFIVKPSKASKSSYGLSQEKKVSLSFHQSGIPILVSASILRSRGLGQIDVARLEKNIIEVGEVKNSEVGVNSSQRIRLKGALCFLSSLLGRASKLIEFVG